MEGVGKCPSSSRLAATKFVEDKEGSDKSCTDFADSGYRCVPYYACEGKD